MRAAIKDQDKRKSKRDVFAELTEGMTALAESRQGKRTLRTHVASPDRVAVVGLGIMGSAMSKNLIGAGFPVLGYDVLAGRRREFSRAGGKSARSVGEAAARARIVITSLPSAEALLEVAARLAATHSRGQIVVETSTLPIAIK